jgi:hypothetical protein
MRMQLAVHGGQARETMELGERKRKKKWQRLLDKDTFSV